MRPGTTPQRGLYFKKLPLKRGLFLLSVFLLVLAPGAGCEGDIKDLKLFEYWDNGKVRKCTVYDVYGYLKTKAFCRYDGTVEKIEKYDKAGNKTEEALYNSKGELREGIDGWAAMKWRYDGAQLVAEVAFDENGNPIERKFYSESGKLLFRQYRDDDRFNPYESASMALMLGGCNVPYKESDV
jgi:hypothetical protein